MPRSAAPKSIEKTADNPPIRLIWGEDDYSVKARGREWFDVWGKQLDTEDREIIDGSAANAGEALLALRRLREALQTLPFFGSTKIVWLKDAMFFADDRTSSSQAVAGAVADLVQDLKTLPWEKLRLLISAGKVDKRKSFYRTVAKLGAVEAFAGLTADDRDWQVRAEDVVRSLFRDRSIAISAEAIAGLVNAVGPNLRQLHSESEKVALYAGGDNPIPLDDVLAVVTRTKQARAFALGDALGDRDLPKLLGALDQELWEMKTDRQKSVIGLLYGLISKVRTLLFARELLDRKVLRAENNYARFKSQLERIPENMFPSDRRFNPAAMNPYVLFRAHAQCRHYQASELIDAMAKLLECNRQLISSGMEDALVLQRALIHIVKPA